ncbi:MAG: RNA-binding protein [Spirochaetales bacterium]|nr:RNA-binding protein [Spirochaetales bacterium]
MQNSKLYVGNLDYAVDETELKDLFANYGTVKYVKVIEGKGFGFVELETQAEAENAKKELNGSEYKGRTLRVDNARPQKNRTRKY